MKFNEHLRSYYRIYWSWFVVKFVIFILLIGEFRSFSFPLFYLICCETYLGWYSSDIGVFVKGFAVIFYRLWSLRCRDRLVVSTAFCVMIEWNFWCFDLGPSSLSLSVNSTVNNKLDLLVFFELRYVYISTNEMRCNYIDF